ncbi:MAG: hypothetical protein Q8R11_03490, partial [bacterium]|nr:hypothetical protein [bacterium]
MMKRLGLALFFAVIGITVIAWQTVYAAMPQIDPQAYSSNAPSSIYNQIIRGNIRFRIADQIFSGANIFVEVVGQLNNFVAQTFTDTSGNYEVRVDRSLYTITPSAANRQFLPPSIGLDSQNGATGQVYNWNNFEATPVFTNLSATLQENQATFQFSFSDQTSDYHIDLSTLSDMSSDTYLSFGRGG